MSDSLILARLRSFLLLTVASLCVLTMVELWLDGHTVDLQVIPFVLCSLGLLAVAAFWFRPGRGTLLTLRAALLPLPGGSLLGMYLHVSGNLAFALEIRPNASLGDVWYEGLTGGSPPLAPGMLALAAALAAAATWRHPAAARQAN